MKRTNSCNFTLLKIMKEVHICGQCSSVFSSSVLLRGHHRNGNCAQEQQAEQEENDEDNNVSQMQQVEQIKDYKDVVAAPKSDDEKKKNLVCTRLNCTYSTMNARSLKYHLGTHKSENKCKECGKCLRSSKNLRLHMRIHTGEKPYECSECGKSLNRSDKLKQHIMRAHPEIHPQQKIVKDVSADLKDDEKRGHRCTYLNCTFSTKYLSLFKLHFRVHTGEKPYKCNECVKSFSCSDKLKLHIKRVHLEFHTQEIIEEGLSASAALKDDVEKKNHRCNYLNCAFSTNYLSLLKVHLRVHTGERPYKCNKCHKSYKRSSHLKQHMIHHTSEKPFKCSECHKSFKRSDHLEQHMKLHTCIGESSFNSQECDKSLIDLDEQKELRRVPTGEKPHKCNECGKSFSFSKYLKQHMRIHSGEKPYKCNQCDYSTGHGTSLKNHLRIHINEHPLKCQICSFVCQTSDQLIVHLRTHTGETLFNCPHCSSKFPSTGELKSHLIMHTGDKPYVCFICDYKGVYSETLKRHMFRKHSIDRIFNCEVCTFKTRSIVLLIRHTKKCKIPGGEERFVECPHQSCSRKFSLETAMTNHLKSHLAK